MKITESRCRMLLAVVLDGTEEGDGSRVPARKCSICGAWLVRFVASPGLQAASGVAGEVEACTNTKALLGMPCPGAIKAKPLLDALKTATVRT